MTSTKTAPAREPAAGSASRPTLSGFLAEDQFVTRHNGPRPADVQAMLGVLGYPSLDALIDAIVPEDIRLRRPLALPSALTERTALAELRAMASRNHVFRSYIGMGYYDTVTPPVILRNILENPGWYTAYTPYQAEIAQGRLEALLNFQTVVSDLTGLEIANASLLDEGTAAAEAMHLTHAMSSATGPLSYLVDQACHPQTIEVVRTRAEARGIAIVVADPRSFAFAPGVIGALIQYPATDGSVEHWGAFCDKAHAAGALVTVATDLLALTLLEAPGTWGADIASATASASACRSDTGARMPGSSPPATRTSETCRDVSSACPRIAPAARRCGWRSRPGNSTSGAKRRPATSAPPRCCSR